MIPGLGGNHSASWNTHVHSLFGLEGRDYDDGGGVRLDDSPFILGESVEGGEGQEEDWRGRVFTPTSATQVWEGTGEDESGGSAGVERGVDTIHRAATMIQHLSSATPGRHDDAASDGSFWLRSDETWVASAHNTTLNATEAWNGEWISELNGTTWNVTLNGSWEGGKEGAPLVVTPESLALCLLLLFFAVSTIFGNGLVIVAVARERYLHTVTNYFIMSLAVADCLVGALVMPFSALYDSFDYWPFGPDFCDVWRSFDVLASTASILNLCVISLDRYWAITDPFSYPARMSSRRAYVLIALVWVCSALISFPAIAWWRAVGHSQVMAGVCPFTEDLSYLVFSSTISFYGPLLVMVFTYFRIYRAATEQTRSLKLGQKLVSAMGDGEMELTLRIHRGGGGSSGGSGSNGNGVHRAHYPAGKSLSYSTTENGGLEPHSLADPRLSSPLDDPENCPLGSMHEGASPDSSTKVVARNLKTFSISRKLCKFAKEKKSSQDPRYRDGSVYRVLAALLRDKPPLGAVW